jgi:uncharacterized OB-fold protein
VSEFVHDVVAIAGHSAGDATGDVGSVGLRTSCCPACQYPAFPAEVTCSRCGEPSAEVILEEAGTVLAVTTVRHQPPRALVEVPYEIAMVAYPNGLAIFGLVSKEAGGIGRGDRVALAAVPMSDGRLTFGYRREGRP